MIDLTPIFGTYTPIPIVTSETMTILSLDVNYIVRVIVVLMLLKFVLTALLGVFKCFR